MKTSRRLMMCLFAAIAACNKTPAESAPVDAAPPTASDAAPPEHRFAKHLRQDFGKKYSCPEERVDVKVRADLDPVQALAPGEDFSLGTAPAEVQADPARLAKWTADREADVASKKSKYTQNTMFEVSGCGHDDVLACHEHKGMTGGVTYPDVPDCESPKPPKAQAPTLATLATAKLENKRWTALDVAPAAKLEAFDVDANIDWASSIATAWSPDAKLFHVLVEQLPLDGALDLTGKSITSVTYNFNSTSKGDVDLAVDVDPVSTRSKRTASAPSVMQGAHRDKTTRSPLAKPKCTLARAFAAIKAAGTLAKADPAFKLTVGLRSEGAKTMWSFAYVIASKGQSTDVDATTCALAK